MWRSEFCIIVSAKDRVQNKIVTPLKFKVNKTYKKDEKITTNFEPSSPEDARNKDFLSTTLGEVNGHIVYIEKIILVKRIFQDPINKLIRTSKIEQAVKVKATIELVYDRRMCNRNDNADEVIKNYLLIKITKYVALV